jgi:DnaK suppressor protein
VNPDNYKQLLEERLSVINQGHDARQRNSVPVQLDQSSVGRLSRMDAMQQQAMAQETSRRSELEKQRIHAALKRLDEGE